MLRIIGILITLLATGCYGAAPEAVPLDAKLQSIVDHYSDPVVVDALVTEGMKAAEAYDAQKIDAIVHADRHYAQSWVNWYDVPLITTEHPGMVPRRGDLAFAGLAASYWAIEWKFFSMLMKKMHESYATHLKTKDAWDPHFRACFQRETMAQLMPLVVGYTIATMALSALSKRLHLKTWLTAPPSETSLTQTIAAPARTSLMNAMSPHSWIEGINDWLDYFGLVPPWSQATWCTFIKSLSINLVTVILCEKYVVAGSIHESYEFYGNHQAFLHALDAGTLMVPYSSWLEKKLWTASILHAATGLTLIAAHGYTAYRRITQEATAA